MANGLIAILLITVSSLLSSQVQAEELTKLRIHYPQLPPYIYLNGESEQVSGILPELFEPFFLQQQLNSQYVFNHPQRAEQALYHGDIDAMFVSQAWLENPDALVFSVAVLSFDDYLFSLRPEDVAMDLTTLRELKICTREHYIYPQLEHYFARQGFIRVDASSEEAQLKMLMSQRCDLMYMNDIIASWLMLQQLRQVRLYALPQAIARASLHLSLHPRWQSLLPALNQFILQQQQNGTINRVIQHHSH